jgi:hypothetical protein
MIRLVQLGKRALLDSGHIAGASPTLGPELAPVTAASAALALLKRVVRLRRA